MPDYLISAARSGVTGISALLRQLVMPHLAVQLQDGRSKIIKQACNLVSAIAECLSGEFEACADIVLQELMKLLGSSAAIMADSADSTIRTSTQKSPRGGPLQATRTLSKVFETAPGVKKHSPEEQVGSIRVREYVLLALEVWGPQGELVCGVCSTGAGRCGAQQGELVMLVDAIESSIRSGVQDGTREVRERVGGGCEKRCASHSQAQLPGVFPLMAGESHPAALLVYVTVQKVRRWGRKKVGRRLGGEGRRVGRMGEGEGGMRGERRRIFPGNVTSGQDPPGCTPRLTSGSEGEEVGRWGGGEVARWGGGEVARWRGGEVGRVGRVGRWGGGEGGKVGRWGGGEGGEVGRWGGGEVVELGEGRSCTPFTVQKVRRWGGGEVRTGQVWESEASSAVSILKNGPCFPPFALPPSRLAHLLFSPLVSIVFLLPPPQVLAQEDKSAALSAHSKRDPPPRPSLLLLLLQAAVGEEGTEGEEGEEEVGWGLVRGVRLGAQGTAAAAAAVRVVAGAGGGGGRGGEREGVVAGLGGAEAAVAAVATGAAGVVDPGLLG
ncbi:unnamed protein product [Closterium sp. Naga37s-1]|nr:unnamed protein product [Closterium sp. Naga37s-1]